METQLIFQLTCIDLENVKITIDNSKIDPSLWIKRNNGKWDMEYRLLGRRNLIVSIIVAAQIDETVTLELWRIEENESIGSYSLNVKKDNTAESKLVIFVNKPYKETVPSPNAIEKTSPAMVIPEREMVRPPRETRGFEKKNIPDVTGNFEVLIFFGTNRNTIWDEGKVKFGVERDSIHYGTVLVNIPKNKEMGEIPRPKWWKLEFRENPDKHVMIIDREILQKDEFFPLLQQTIANSDENDAFIFIHGYNVAFDEAAMRTAQIAHDVKFGGAPILFSWPSRASLEGYFSDEDNVVYSQSDMIQFLKDVREKTGAKKLHLIAHSMGNRALTAALVELQRENNFEDFQFTQIILAAPDIDAQIFCKDIAPKLAGSSNGQITLYVSEKDNALRASRSFRKNLRRVGDGGADIVCAKGIETIDASDIDTDLLGHGYFAQTKSLLDDISTILEKNEIPEKRNLKSKHHNDFEYWTF
ncbi:alpha/beta hydrolase [Aequorivita sp. H23M31]|uniref:Alpha/beta hydrolase n=1 Tax=Aequorivita ciconiae TaxID=2494375 RepID=A0A410G1T9_9FLAO|nr:alpha/beta hydrolase [Aequorivita sp. H23M31]QAA81233.1 alpha/beta hydrolase [Aequorivita sp. H23M31]